MMGLADCQGRPVSCLLFGSAARRCADREQFIKKPERIEALGMILLICLLIWNLMQRSMRIYVEKTGTTLEGWQGKPTDRPTSFMMTTKFQGLLVVRVDHIRVLKPGLTQTQKKYLLALGVREEIFTDPRPG